MKFLEIFKTMKNNPSLFFTAFDNFKELYSDIFSEYGSASLLELRLSPDLKALGFFYYYSEFECENIASMSFFDLKFIVKDIDFFTQRNILVVNFYRKLVELLNFENSLCK